MNVVDVPRYEKLPYTYFWRSTSVFSQWYKTRFEVDGIKYMCAEQYMMQQKASMYNVYREIIVPRFIFAPLVLVASERI